MYHLYSLNLEDSIVEGIPKNKRLIFYSELGYMEKYDLIKKQLAMGVNSELINTLRDYMSYELIILIYNINTLQEAQEHKANYDLYMNFNEGSINHPSAVLNYIHNQHI